MLSLASNIQALRATRWLGQASSIHDRGLERLSSGTRLTRASDDAAGLAIADSLRVAARLHSQAVRNLSDGLSALNILSGALQDQTGILMRLQELAQQAANGVYTDAQREVLNREYLSLVQEFGRLADGTSFNGQRLLWAGRGDSPKTLTFQAGIGSGASSLLSFDSFDTGTFSGRAAEGAVRGIFGHVFNPMSTQELADTFAQRLATMSVPDSEGVLRDVRIAIVRAQNGGVYEVHAFYRGSDSLWAPVLRQGTSSQTIVSFTANEDTGVIDGNGLLTATGELDGGNTANFLLDFRGLRFDLPSPQTQGPTDFITNDTTATTSIEWSGIETRSRALASLTIVTNRLSDLSVYTGIAGAMQSRIATAMSLAVVNKEGAQSADARIRDADLAVETASLVAAGLRRGLTSRMLSVITRQSELVLGLLR